MSTVTVNQGAVGVDFTDTLTANGSPVDLSTATAVHFVLRDGGGNQLVDAAGTIVDAPSGTVAYTTISGDLDTLGELLQTWHVTYPSDPEETYPSTGHNTVDVVADVPVTTYATLDEARTWAELPDTSNDLVLAVVNEATSRAIDGYTGRRFYPQALATRVFQAIDPVVLDVQDFHDASSVIVETDDNADGVFETTWSTIDYQLEPLNADALGRPFRQLIAIDVRIWPTGVWLAGSPFEIASYPTRARRACVRITAKWGWPAVPSDVKLAQWIQVSRFFKRKQSPFGIAGSPDLGEIRMLASRLDPDTKVLLEQYLPAGARGPSTVRIG